MACADANCRSPFCGFIEPHLPQSSLIHMTGLFCILQGIQLGLRTNLKVKSTFRKNIRPVALPFHTRAQLLLRRNSWRWNPLLQLKSPMEVGISDLYNRLRPSAAWRSSLPARRSIGCTQLPGVSLLSSCPYLQPIARASIVSAGQVAFVRIQRRCFSSTQRYDPNRIHQSGEHSSVLKFRALGD